MNLHALRIFKTVADFRSVTKAAELLRLSQPAVTIQIRQLEKELDVKLVVSKGRGIQLTEVGEIVAEEANRLFALEASIEAKFADVKKQAAAKITIASTYLPSTFLLPPFFAKYKAKNSDAQIILQTGNSTDMLHNLQNYKADIGVIVSETINEPNIHSKHWLDIEFYFVTHPNHELANKKVDLQEVVKYPFILREEGSSTRTLLNSLCLTKCVPPPVEGLIFGGLVESIHAILAGYGIMLAPSIAVESYLANKQLCQIYINELQIIRPVYLCTRINDPYKAHHEAFINSLL